MAQGLLLNSPRSKLLLWVCSGLISLGLLSLVIAQVDMNQATAMLQGLSWVMLGGAFVFLMLEGIATALRLWLFAQRRPRISQALKANAWYVLLLVLMPARLGEVAAIFVLERHLNQKYGAAAMSIIAQRLYDIIILGVVFLFAFLGFGDFVDYQTMSIIALILISFAFFLLLRLDLFLTFAALMFHKAPKVLYRFILQARAYSRHSLQVQDVPLALFLTILKWLGNLGALIFLFIALNLGLSTFENMTVAVAYNFLAIIPLQTIGGIGVGEVGLALLFAGMGLSTGIAAGASLMVRVVILIFPFIFFSLIMGGLKLQEKIRV